MTGLLFHHFHGGTYPKLQGSLSGDQLQRLIERYRDRLLSAKDFLDRRQNGSRDDDGVVLTFDDGARSQYEIAKPILDAEGLTAFWFPHTAPLIGIASREDVYRWLRNVAWPSAETFYDAWRRKSFALAAPVGYRADAPWLTQQDRNFRYWRDEVATPQVYERVMDDMFNLQRPYPTQLWLTPDHVRELHAEGHIIGTHSHSHPLRMDRLTKEAQEIEYVTSTYILEQILGVRPTTMSHPSNAVTTEGSRILHDLGYVLGFKATPDCGGPLEVGRVNVATLS